MSSWSFEIEKKCYLCSCNAMCFVLPYFILMFKKENKINDLML